MTAVATGIRRDLARILKDAGLSAFSQMPPALAPGAVVVMPDGPYGKPYSVGDEPTYVYQYVIAVHGSTLDLEAGLADIEELIERVCEALPAGVDIDQIGQPRVEAGTTLGPIYMAEINITTTGRK